jgi:CheY-like chemotaxis protein
MTDSLVDVRRQLVVLSVEDEKETISGTLEAIKVHGLVVRECQDLIVAERWLAEKYFDLALIDLRLPRGDDFLQDGGVTLIRRLSEGEAHSRNADIPCVLFTAYSHSVDVEGLGQYSCYAGLISKLGSPTESLLHLCRQLLGEGALIDPLNGLPGYIVETLLTVMSGPDGDGRYEIYISSWPISDSVSLPIDGMPPEVEQELEFGERPVHLWARVNLAATRPDELRPHRWRLAPVTPQGASDFTGKRS